LTKSQSSGSFGVATIIALARAGAVDLAQAQFSASGLDQREDASTRALKGRLIKEQATRLTGRARRAAYRRAAEAYASAAAIQTATYPLINAASLFLLAGAKKRSRELACEALTSLEVSPDEPETPYYLHATRSEALLLLERQEEAQVALARAISNAPLAWEDHASTLRQFALILDAQGRDALWLNEHRPPASLHFGGHMSFAAAGQHAALRDEITTILAKEEIGFGFGALAAGADIIVAEALLEHGAELHAVLPGGAEAFAAVSVDPFGAEWRRRFDAVLARAAEVRAVRPLGAAPDANTIALADEVAMGVAVMNARRLESAAVQLLVVADSASQRARDAWADAGWRQHLVTAPREDVLPEVGRPPQRGSRLLALLAVAPPPEVHLGDWLDPLREALAALPRPSFGPYLEAAHVVLAYETPLAAAEAAAALRGARPEVRIGGHYTATQVFHDPFAGGERIGIDAAAAATGALASTLPCTTYVTEDFAAALVASGQLAPRTEFIGELDPPGGEPPIGLHVLKS
jgi:hypothetical protein